MSIDRRKGLLYGAAVAIRLLLLIAFPALPNLLSGRVEISTPVNSFKRLQEGLFLHNHNVSPYDGGIFHQAPLLLPLFAVLPSASTYPIFTSLLYIALDLFCADALMRIADSGVAVSSRLFKSPRKEIRWDKFRIAAAFLFNPITIATCIGRPTTVFTNCAILYAIAEATAGRSSTSILALSAAAYLSLFPILLFPPIVLLCFDVQFQKTKVNLTSFAIRCAAVFIGASGALLYMSYLVSGGSWQYLSSTYGVQLLLPDLTPNVGLWWYFFIEMFDSFREFFLGVFWLHLAGYVGGLCIRLRNQPLFVLTSLLGIFAIFQPYPSISDSSLFMAAVPLYRHVFPLMRYTFFTVSALLYASLLGPAFYYLWIYAGSGNANFFYAITLVWSLGLSTFISDLLFAVLRDEWEVERPEMKGKEVRQL